MRWGLMAALVAVAGVNNGGEPDAPQRGANTCGAVALRACLGEHGIDAAVADVCDRLPRQGEYSSLLELQSTARSFGMHSIGVRWAGDVPPGAPPGILPVVLPSGRRHFVAALEYREASMLIQDGSESLWVSTKALRNSDWDGTILHVAPTQSEIKALTSRWSEVSGIIAIGILALIGTVFLSRRKRLEVAH